MSPQDKVVVISVKEPDVWTEKEIRDFVQQ